MHRILSRLWLSWSFGTANSVIIDPSITLNNFWGVIKRNLQERFHLLVFVLLRNDHTADCTKSFAGN